MTEAQLGYVENDFLPLYVLELKEAYGRSNHESDISGEDAIKLVK